MPVLLTRAEVFEKARAIAAEQASVDPTAVTDETIFQADLDYDSLDLVEFTMKLEDAFDIAISDQEADDVKTVGDAARLLCRALGLDAAPADQRDV